MPRSIATRKPEPRRAPAILEFRVTLGSAPEEPSHENRGEDGRGCGRRPLEGGLKDVVLDPTLLRYVYEPVRDVLADEVGDTGRQYGYEPLLRRVVHAPSFFVL